MFDAVVLIDITQEVRFRGVICFLVEQLKMACDRFHIFCDCFSDESLKLHLSDSDGEIDSQEEKFEAETKGTGKAVSKRVLRSKTTSVQKLPSLASNISTKTSSQKILEQSHKAVFSQRTSHSHIVQTRDPTKRRRRLKGVATEKIPTEKKSTIIRRHFFSKIAFARLVREVTDDLKPNTEIKFQKTAFEALQLSCEAFLETVFQSVGLVATHCGRATILQRDMQLVQKLSEKFQSMKQ